MCRGWVGGGQTKQTVLGVEKRESGNGKPLSMSLPPAFVPPHSLAVFLNVPNNIGL